MDLQEFAKKQTLLALAFERYWNTRHKKDPEKFPMTLSYSEWFEQYIIWLPGQVKEIP